MFLEILRINSCNNYSILQHTTAHYSILLQYSIKKPSVLWKTWTLGIQLGPPGLSVVLHLGTQNLEVPRLSSAEGVSCNLFPLKSQHYPLVNVYIAMERSTIFNGKIHYKTQFSIAMLNYQRVCGFFSRMRSKGSRFTLGVWGLRVCSLDVAFASATVRNRPQSFATVRVRTVWPCLWEVLQRWSFLEVSDVWLLRFAWQAWHFVTFRRVLQRVESRFAWQAQYFCDVFRRRVAVFVAGAALWTRPSSFFVAGAAL